ncbi:MAG: hypothetical protein N3G78_13620 [Desulfobacterota bacterium]|nr:hypothetical protein [Thermodesulfobacteriota bacterium]
MSETAQLLLGFLFLVAVFLLTRWLMVVKIQATCKAIIKELQSRGAFSPDTAVHLPYEKPQPLRMGTRDYRPKAIEALLHSGLLIKTEGGRYYLAHRQG